MSGLRIGDSSISGEYMERHYTQRANNEKRREMREVAEEMAMNEKKEAHKNRLDIHKRRLYENKKPFLVKA